MIKRAIAKIAFNFFAYFNKKLITLDTAFDNVRTFIVNGTGPINIFSENRPMLGDECNSSLRRVGHMVSIEKNFYGQIISRVSLFNSMSYTVVLAERFDNPNLKVDFGKYFDITTKKIFDLQMHSIKIPRISLEIPKIKIHIYEPKIWVPFN